MGCRVLAYYLTKIINKIYDNSHPKRCKISFIVSSKMGLLRLGLGLGFGSGSFYMREITIPNKLLELLNVVTSKFTGLQRSYRLEY